MGRTKDGVFNIACYYVDERDWKWKKVSFVLVMFSTRIHFTLLMSETRSKVKTIGKRRSKLEG